MGKRKISKDASHRAYDVSKNVNSNAISFTEGVKILSADTGMNENSASDYIHNFKCLVEGKLFTRTTNNYSLNLYLQNIYNDYGAIILRKALSSLSQHVLYYEGLRKINCKGAREIIVEFSALLSTENTMDYLEQERLEEEIRSDKPKTQRSTVSISNLLKDSTSGQKVEYRGKTYKRNNVIIAILKDFREYKCQFCGSYIPKADGSKYIEAAHIKAKCDGGDEHPHNIVLLCPNHHKELDLGEHEFTLLAEQNRGLIKLNGKIYKVDLSYL